MWLLYVKVLLKGSSKSTLSTEAWSQVDEAHVFSSQLYSMFWSFSLRKTFEFDTLIIKCSIVQRHNQPMWSNNFISGYTHIRTESRDSNRYLHTSVHKGIIYNSQKTEISQMSIGRWIAKQNVVYTYSEILLDLNNV